jgi:hypothetical protein
MGRSVAHAHTRIHTHARPAARSRSEAAASNAASGFTSSTALSLGPWALNASIRAQKCAVARAQVISPRVIASCSSRLLISWMGGATACRATPRAAAAGVAVSAHRAWERCRHCRRCPSSAGAVALTVIGVTAKVVKPAAGAELAGWSRPRTPRRARVQRSSAAQRQASATVGGGSGEGGQNRSALRPGARARAESEQQQ